MKKIRKLPTTYYDRKELYLMKYAIEVGWNRLFDKIYTQNKKLAFDFYPDVYDNIVALIDQIEWEECAYGTSILFLE